MRMLLLGVLLMIAGCAGTINDEHMIAAGLACNGNGGVRTITSYGYEWNSVTAHCRNGATITGPYLKRIFFATGDLISEDELRAKGHAIQDLMKSKGKCK